MKNTSLKTLEARQKAFTLLSGPARFRILNQLMDTPDISLQMIAKRVGFSKQTVYTATKALLDCRAINCENGLYFVNDTTVEQLSNLVHSAGEFQLALQKFKGKGAKRMSQPPQLRAVL